MRRLAFSILLVLLAGASIPGIAAESDVLVAPDGAVYVAEVVAGELIPEESSASSALRLTIQRGEQTSSVFVPGSLEPGEHWNPALAYDPQTATLFVFWVSAPQITTSEIVLCSYRDGVFGETTSLDLGVFRWRENLRIAITRWADDSSSDERAHALAIHAVWWDTAGRDERARYALLQISEGSATVVHVTDLVEYLGEHRELEPLLFEGELPRALRFPSVTTNVALDRAEILFADSQTSRLYRLDVVPVAANGVLGPPVGIWRSQIPGLIDSIEVHGTVSAMFTGSGEEDLLLYTVGDGAVEYMLYREGEWSATMRIPLDERVSEPAALQALRKLLVTH